MPPQLYTLSPQIHTVSPRLPGRATTFFLVFFFLETNIKKSIQSLDLANLLNQLETEGIEFEEADPYRLPTLDITATRCIRQVKSIRITDRTASGKSADIKVKTIEQAFPNPILEKQPGNKGTLVTSFGKELLKKYLVLSDHLTKESEEFINWATSKQSVK